MVGSTERLHPSLASIPANVNLIPDEPITDFADCCRFIFFAAKKAHQSTAMHGMRSGLIEDLLYARLVICRITVLSVTGFLPTVRVLCLLKSWLGTSRNVLVFDANPLNNIIYRIHQD